MTAASGAVILHKRLTTPHDPSEAALIGLEELVEMGGIALARGRRDRPRHDAGHQRR